MYVQVLIERGRRLYDEHGYVKFFRDNSFSGNKDFGGLRLELRKVPLLRTVKKLTGNPNRKKTETARIVSASMPGNYLFSGPSAARDCVLTLPR
jgi:hypothetical protein